MSNDWVQTTLGDVEYFEPLGTGVKPFSGVKDYLSTSSIEGTRIANVEEEISFAKRPSRANLQPVPNSVFFARMRETCKVIEANKYLCERAILSTGFCGIRSEQVASAFLKQFALFEAFERQKDNLAEGSTQAALTNAKLDLIRIAFPRLITEQAKIAEILSTVDRAIEQIEALIAKKHRSKTGLMQDLFTRGIDEHGNLRSEHSHEFKDTPTGRVPTAWAIKTLNECVRADAPICYGILMPGQGFDNGVPVIKVRDIVGGRVLQEDLLLTDPRIDHLYSRSRLCAGDLLVTIRGTTGRIARVPSELEGANITQDTARVRLDARCSHRFYYFLLQSTAVQAQISLHTIGQAVKGINIGDVKKLQVVTPSRDEQEEIADRLEAIDATLCGVQLELSKLRSLKSGLMQDLLTGRRRVTALVTRLEEAGA